MCHEHIQGGVELSDGVVNQDPSSSIRHVTTWVTHSMNIVAYQQAVSMTAV